MNKVTCLLFVISLTISHAILAEDNEGEQITPAEVEQLLAPIALYPDTLLTHILVSSTYPIEVVEAQRWLDKNTDLNSDDALAAVEAFDWDPSVKALVAFPSVLSKLSEELSWTYRLGDTFLADEQLVMSSIQALRLRAEEAGNLDTTENVNISKSQDNIIIESSQPDVIYVPYYDTRIVYGDWRWRRYPPVYWHIPYNYAYSSYNGLFYYSAGYYSGLNYFYSDFHWYNRHIVVIKHPKKRHHHSRGKLVHNANAKHWKHQSSHRKGVNYRYKSTQKKYSNKARSNKEYRNKEYRNKEYNNKQHVRYDKNAGQSPQLYQETYKKKYNVNKNNALKISDGNVNKQKSRRHIADTRPNQKTTKSYYANKSNKEILSNQSYKNSKNYNQVAKNIGENKSGKSVRSFSKKTGSSSSAQRSKAHYKTSMTNRSSHKDLRGANKASSLAKQHAKVRNIKGVKR